MTTFKRKDEKEIKTEKTKELFEQLNKELEKERQYKQGIRNILTGATIALGEIYEIDQETNQTIITKTEEELLQILEEGKGQLETEIKEEKKLLTRWKLKKITESIGKSLEKAKELIKQEREEDRKLRERIAEAIMQFKMLQITNKKGEPETKEKLKEKTSEELIKMMEEGMTELERIIGKRGDEFDGK